VVLFLLEINFAIQYYTQMNRNIEGPQASMSREEVETSRSVGFTFDGLYRQSLKFCGAGVVSTALLWEHTQSPTKIAMIALVCGSIAGMYVGSTGRVFVDSTTEELMHQNHPNIPD
jgi:hypothetical protein